MKLKYLKYVGLFSLVSMYGCIGFEPVTIESRADRPIYKPSQGGGAEKLVDGVLYDFRGGVGEWWADSKISLSKQGNAMKVSSMGSGPSYEPFGVNFDPKDFTNTPVIRIKIKLDPKTKDFPDLRMDLKDINDMQTNGAPAVNKIVQGDGFVEYFYDLNHKFTQSWPSSAIVDQTKIAGMQFFFNPGGSPFYGTIYIEDIYVMANQNGSGIVDRNIVLDDFSNGGSVGMWWPCKKEKVTVSMGDKAMKVHFENGEWDCFGKIFGETDISENPVIRIKAKAVSNTPMKMTNVMARFIDVNENSTDLIDGENMSEFEIGSNDYGYFYSAFKTKYENNLYSSQGEFDPKRVNRVIIFFNMNKETQFTGDVLIQEVAFVADLPDKQKMARSPWGASPSIDPKLPVAQKLDNSAFAKPESWKATKGNVSVSASSDNKGVKFSGKNIGVALEELTASIVPFNLDSMIVIRVRAKAKGNMNPVIRLDVVDDKGLQTNGRPQEFEVKNGADYTDYYINMSTNYYQRTPKYGIVNVKNSSQLKLYINYGMSKGFDGDIEIAEIQPITLGSAPDKIKSIFE